MTSLVMQELIPDMAAEVREDIVIMVEVLLVKILILGIFSVVFSVDSVVAETIVQTQMHLAVEAI